MAKETLTFSCPACGIKLTVPAGLAGVTGPCPSCHSQIQAPTPQPPASDIPPPAAPDSSHSHQTPPPAPVHSAPAPPTLKPEPRHLPNRPHPPELVAKQMPEPTPSDDQQQPTSTISSRPIHNAGLLRRLLMLIVFLVASGALVFGILTVLKMQTEKEPRLVDTPPRSASAERRAGDSKPLPPSLPTPTPEQPILIEPAPDLPNGIEPKAAGMEALEVLEKFLTANSLAERLPIIETKTPEAELATSCLAGPLPSAPRMLLEFQESHPLEEVVDLYYSVDFEEANHPANPQTILVRTRGKGDPKVVVDPFLDLFGGRLAAYASTPTDKAGVFQVIASALASCTNPKVPNREKKLTLKLLARENTKEIAEAYFGKHSKIGEILEDGNYSLSYGKAKACTVMLRWNTEDDVNQPYLEAIAIKTLDWNP